MTIEQQSISKQYTTEDIQRMISETSEREVVDALFEDDIEYLLINISLFTREMQEFIISKLLRDKKEGGAYLILDFIENIPSLTSDQVTEICKLGYGKSLADSMKIGLLGKENISRITRFIARAGIERTQEAIRPLNNVFDEVVERKRISRIRDPDTRHIETQALHSKILRQKIALSQCISTFEEVTDIDPDADKFTIKTMFYSFLKLYGFPKTYFEIIDDVLKEYYENRERMRNLVRRFTNDSGEIDSFGLYDYIVSKNPETDLGKLFSPENITRAEVGKYSIRFFFQNKTQSEEEITKFTGYYLNAISVEFVLETETTEKDRTKIHEEQHAFYDLIVKKLPNVSLRKFITSSIAEDLVIQNKDVINKLRRLFGLKDIYNDYVEIQRINDLILYSLNKIKDETLAQISDEDKNETYIISLFDIENKGSSYNHLEYYREHYRETDQEPIFLEQQQKYESIIEKSVKAALRLLNYLKIQNRNVPYEVIYRKAKNFLTFAPFDQWEFWVDEYIRTGH